MASEEQVMAGADFGAIPSVSRRTATRRAKARGRTRTGSAPQGAVIETEHDALMRRLHAA
jgi:hypothetical protein